MGIQMCCHQKQQLKTQELPQQYNSYIQKCIRLLTINKKLQLGKEENQIIQKIIQQYDPYSEDKQNIILKKQTKLSAVVQNKRYFYLGEYNQKFEGKGKLVIQQNKIFDGTFRNNKFQGPGQLLMTDIQKKTKIILKGQWNKIFKGEIIVENVSFNLPFQIDLSIFNQASKLVYIQYPNYDQYFGEIQDNMALGEGIYIYRNNNPSRNYPIYIGKFHKGQRTGQGTMHYNETRRLQITWKEGKADGQGILTINKVNYPICYNNGKRNERIVSAIQQTN